MESLLNFLFPSEFLRSFIEDVALALWGAFADWWWLVLPLALFYLALEYWINYNQENFKKSIQWVDLELKVPREVLTTPKAMEQVFSGLSVMASTPDTWLGEVPLWVSFELVGTINGISFFVHAPKKFQRLIEAQFRSQYPQAEILEVEDYVKRFSSLPNVYEDIWGTELALNEAPVFPIKTYDFFEERVEERRLDSLSPLLEILSHLNEGEEIWVQIVLRGLTKPQSDSWKEKSQEKLNELAGREKPLPKPGGFAFIKGFINETKSVAQRFVADIGSSFGVGAPEAPKEEKKEEKKDKTQTPGEKDRIELVERKLSKPVFDAVIRAIYHAPKSIFSKDSQSSAINSFFRTFTVSSLNGFKGKRKDYFFLYNWLFGDNISHQDSLNFFNAYKDRSPDPAPQFSDPKASEDIMKKMILSADELATLYHFPITQVEAPRLYRSYTKKYEPPPNLPVI
jgi:hypothetical protein